MAGSIRASGINGNEFRREQMDPIRVVRAMGRVRRRWPVSVILSVVVVVAVLVVITLTAHSG